jgi:aminocarboxymuconate-semialdehyde decarboxylase
MTAAPVVDVHAHVIIPALQGFVQQADPVGFGAMQALEARRAGPESQAVSGRMIGERFPRLTVLERRLADMDATGVDVQIVSPSPNHYSYYLAPAHATTLCRMANEAVRDLVESAPDRLGGLGQVPLQHPDLMVAALDHAVLECGLLGVQIGSYAPTATGGRIPGEVGGDTTVELSDPALEPFWARAEELGAIVFLHPFGCSLDERLDRFYLSNTVSQPAENAVALSHLIYAGVLDRYPALKIVAAHGGGYLPSTIGRSDRAWRVRPDAHGCARPPSSYLSVLYFDSLTHDPRELRALVEVAGPSHVVMGSDYPFDMGSDDPVGEVQAARLDEAGETQVLSGTAAALGLRAGLSSRR